MATLVFFHAHPDDESIATAGSMARYARAGHRVVLVVATKGEHGEVPDGFLDPGETLGDRRVRETQASADVLGVSRVEFLGYVDSGMMGTPTNDAPESFWQADVDEAGERLAAILREERADVLTAYDENGNYGHPDHIQVHRVGLRAGELAGTPKVYMNTVNRDEVKRLLRSRPLPADATNAPDESFVETLGLPGDRITTNVDARDFVDLKRASMRAHASQIAEQSFFLAVPDDDFRAMWGTEWYVLVGAPPGTAEDDLLA